MSMPHAVNLVDPRCIHQLKLHYENEFLASYLCVFAIACHIGHITSSGMQGACEVMFALLARRRHFLLLPSQHQIHPQLGIEVDIHLIFIEHGIFHTAASQDLIDGGHFRLFIGTANVQSQRSQRRMVETCNIRRQFRFSSKAISSVLQREHCGDSWINSSNRPEM